MHVKFASQQREGPYAPANEALAVAILEILGVTRAKRWLVDIPEALVAASSELVDITSRIGLGTEWVDEYSPDISGAQIAVAGKNAPKDELLAQHVVINWLQVGDHSHNFVTEGDRLLAVDFASGPNVQVWNGDAPHGEVVSDEAGLAPLLAGLDQETCRSVASLFDRLSLEDLCDVLGAFPSDWASRTRRLRVAKELMRTKGAIRVVFNC
jgi:hypothetical protein